MTEDTDDFIARITDDEQPIDELEQCLDRAEDALCGDPAPVDAYKFIDRAQQIIEANRPEADDDLP